MKFRYRIKAVYQGIFNGHVAFTLLGYSWNHNYRGAAAFLRDTRQMEEKDERYFLRVAVRS